MNFKKLSEVDRLRLKWTDKAGYDDYKFQVRALGKPEVSIDHPFKSDTHFKHSGQSGDIIYALPAIYALAANGQAHLHLNLSMPLINKKHIDKNPLGNAMLNEKMVNMLAPLLLHQPSIATCDIYNDQTIDYDLDAVRNQPFFLDRGNISRWYFNVFAIWADLSKAWLTAPTNAMFSEHIIIARSHRYRAPGIDYTFLDKYPTKIFVGVPDEYDDMKKQIPSLQYYAVKDFLELATLINSCKLFIGNQSFPFAIAEALKVNRLLEVYYKAPNVVVEGLGGHDFYYQSHFEQAVKMLMK